MLRAGYPTWPCVDSKVLKEASCSMSAHVQCHGTQLNLPPYSVYKIVSPDLQPLKVIEDHVEVRIWESILLTCISLLHVSSKGLGQPPSPEAPALTQASCLQAKAILFLRVSAGTMNTNLRVLT